MKTLKMFGILVLTVAALLVLVAPGYAQTTTTSEVQPSAAVVAPTPPAKLVVSATGTWEGNLEAPFFFGEHNVTIIIRLYEKNRGVVEGNFDSSLIRQGRTILNVPLKGRITEDGVLVLEDQTLAFAGITATIVGNKMTVFTGICSRPCIHAV